MTIRMRLSAAIVAGIAAAVALFATLSIVAIDWAMRSSFQARLLTTARAIETAVDVHHGRPSVDAGDLRALNTMRAATPFAIFDDAGVQIAGEPLPGAQQPVRIVRVRVNRAGRSIGSVAVWQSNAWIGDFDRDAGIISAAIAALLILAAVGLSQRAVRSALGPLEQIASLAEQIEAHDLTGRLHADGSDELGRLCASFDRMLDRLEAAFARERRFAADASHEFRAPLAVLRAEAELALRRDRTSPEYRAALQSIGHEALRLQELVDELLDAARTGTDALSNQSLDAAELARRVGRRVHPAAAMRDISVEVEADRLALAHANGATVERALMAIVHNAIAHAPERGHVRLHVSRRETGVAIEVADDGPGFTAAGLEHATERFWRGNSARPRGGTGLGLAIARTMVEANGGRLEVANAPAGGARVTVMLAG